MNAATRSFRPPTDRQLELLSFTASYHNGHNDWRTHRQMEVALGNNSPNLTPYLNSSAGWAAVFLFNTQQVVAKRYARFDRLKGSRARPGLSTPVGS